MPENPNPDPESTTDENAAEIGLITSFIPSEAKITKPIAVIKEESAGVIAKYIVEVFRFSILISLGGVLVIVLVCFFWQTSSAAGPLIKDALVPFLQALGVFATTVFGPLLAFILGYYFGGGGEGKGPKGS
jgi:cytochrome bd-type quinol oxidase subunit 1